MVQGLARRGVDTKRKGRPFRAAPSWNRGIENYFSKPTFAQSSEV